MLKSCQQLETSIAKSIVEVKVEVKVEDEEKKNCFFFNLNKPQIGRARSLARGERDNSVQYIQLFVCARSIRGKCARARSSREFENCKGKNMNEQLSAAQMFALTLAKKIVCKIELKMCALHSSRMFTLKIRLAHLKCEKSTLESIALEAPPPR